MKIKSSHLISLIFVTILTTYNCLAQQVGKRISETTVALFNNSNTVKNIKLGLKAEALESYTINAQENWISRDFALKTKPIFTIKTADKVVKYTLKLNKTYMIFWNNKKKYWDLINIKNPD